MKLYLKSKMQFNLDLLLDLFQFQFIRDLIRYSCFTVSIQKSVLIFWAIKWDEWMQKKIRKKKRKVKEAACIFTHLYYR